MINQTRPIKKQVFFVGNIILASAAVEFSMLSAITARGTAEEIGKFLFGMTFIQLFSSMLTLGIPPLLVRMSQTLNGKKWTQEMSKLFLIVAAVTAVFCVLCIQFSADLASWLNRDYLTKVMICVAACIASTTFLFLWCGLLQGRNRPIFASLLQFFAIPVVMGVLLLFEKKEIFSHTLLIEHYLTSCATVMLFAFMVWLTSHPAPVKQSPPQDPSHRSWTTFALNALMQQWLMWGGLLLAGPFLNDTEFALLSLAQKLSIVLAILLFAMNYVIAPKLAAAYLSDHTDELRSLTGLSVRVLRQWLAPYSAFICIVGTTAFFVLGEPYTSAMPFFFILILGQLFNVWSGSVGIILMMTHNEKSFSWVLIQSCLLNAMIVIALSWQLGIYGAAIGCALSLIIQNGLAMRAVRQRLGYRLLQRDFA